MGFDKCCIRSLLAAAVWAILSGCATWQPYTPQTAFPGPVVCKKVVPTGSHMPKKMCYPKAVWDQMTADARAIDDALRNGTLQ